MKDTTPKKNEWYVLATASRTDDRTRVLKHGETFAVFDRFGDAESNGADEQGIYHQGTRFLSHSDFEVNGHRPMMLNSSVKDDDSLLAVDLTTPDLYEGGRLAIPKGTVHVFRTKLLWESACHEHIRVANYGIDSVRLRLTFRTEADFADIFEVRGFKRKRRGELLPAKTLNQGLLFGYKGLDGVTRHTRVLFTPAPDEFDGGAAAHFDLTLAANEARELYIVTSCELGDTPRPAVDYAKARNAVIDALRETRCRGCRIDTQNGQFNAWITRSSADVAMLTAGNPEGPYPYAGVPWFSTPFGRDGIIAALHYLWVDSTPAHGVLSFLAATQALERDPHRDAEPGKILHEMRKGELAALGEIPFGRYYGSIDSTPLFIVLAGAYYQRTGDRKFIDAIWENIERALDWIDEYGDRDGDGFVEYQSASHKGLVNQGWKDSHDAIFHRNGELAEGPIALCEVQGYVYRAKLDAAELAQMRGDREKAKALRDQAELLRQRFEEAFWCNDLGTYAIALDGKKRRCEVRSSNAGQVLWSGIASAERAERVADGLMAKNSYSGWGIRTIAAGEPRFNPMSYHNGSIWPHDNALIAAGMARYGGAIKEKAVTLIAGMLDASIAMDQHRLQELFCGFVRRESEGPTLYPVACSPQAWAATSVFYLLQACLGLSFEPDGPCIRIDCPVLPQFLERLRVSNLRVGEAVVDLAFDRHERDVSVNVLRKTGAVQVTVLL
ncbi:MAG: amylo-alpha-1,6-glucosidase [Burkholderiales bacterium]